METFQGFPRPDGQAGVRNHVAVIANCSCANGIVNRIAGEVPEVVPLIHTYGCSIPGEYDRWRRILTGVCSNPNIYAVILIGVGCETDDAREIAAQIRERSGKQVFARIVQEDNGGEAVIEACVLQARIYVREAARQRREAVPVSKLVLGTQCGGSDALSGVTANPVIGYASDWVIGHGGTAILTEVAEMTGTEEMLAARCVTPELGERLKQMVYTEEMAVRKYLGPEASRIIARGNMAGGLTTIQEKALGCIKKGGTTPITGLLDYAEPVGDKKGLVIMYGPGYDPVSLSGLFACGAQVFLYSTGRGNPLGFPAAPCVKICSNSETYYKVGGEDGDMDINAGAIITEDLSVEKVGEKTVKYLLDVCSGKQTKPEIRGYGGALCVYSASQPL